MITSFLCLCLILIRTSFIWICHASHENRKCQPKIETHHIRQILNTLSSIIHLLLRDKCIIVVATQYVHAQIISEYILCLGGQDGLIRDLEEVRQTDNTVLH